MDTRTRELVALALTNYARKIEDACRNPFERSTLTQYAMEDALRDIDRAFGVTGASTVSGSQFPGEEARFEFKGFTWRVLREKPRYKEVISIERVDVELGICFDAEDARVRPTSTYEQKQSYYAGILAQKYHSLSKRDRDGEYWSVVVF